jgi:hypothetical protein
LNQYCVLVSTQDIHRWDSAPVVPGYQLSKNALTCALQQIARDTPVDKLQVVSFHPSVVYTEAAKMAGYSPDMHPWTNGKDPIPWTDGIFRPTPVSTSKRSRLTVFFDRKSPRAIRCLGSVFRGGVRAWSLCLVQLGRGEVEDGAD